MGAGADRYERALSVSRRLAADQEEIAPPDSNGGADPLLMLILYVGGTAGESANQLLDALESSQVKLRVADAYSVFTQYYFLYLHLMLRFAFVQGGDPARASLQDDLTNLLFGHVEAFLSARYGSEPTNSELSPVSEFFFRQLEESEYEFAHLSQPSYEDLLDALAVRLQDVFGKANDTEFARLVKLPARTRGHALENLVARAIEATSNDPAPTS